MKEETPEQFTAGKKPKLHKSEYKEKCQPLKEDPNYIRMKKNQEKAENSLKKWKKEKINHYKKGPTKKGSKKRNSSTEGLNLKNRGNKIGKGISLYQTGKAIVFQ